MTVPTTTDDLIAELENLSEAGFGYEMDAGEISALLAERAELKRDRERLNWMLRTSGVVVEDEYSEGGFIYKVELTEDFTPLCTWFPTPREAIDAAMQELPS